MSRLLWIALALLAAASVALLPPAAAGAVDDHFVLEENGVAQIPVLRNDVPTSSLPALSFDGSTVASVAMGPYLLTYGGMDFYAFLNNDNGQGTGTAITGWSSLAGVAPASLTYTTGDLELIGVTGPSTVAYEVYGEVDGSVDPLRFRVDGVVVGEGTLDTATVVVDRDPASPTFGLATGYGQGRLTGPADSAFYQEAVVASCGTGTLFFELGHFVPTRYSDPDTILVSPRIVPVGFPVVSVTQALHGLVQIDADGVTVTYTPVHGFDGVDSFTYPVRSCDGAEETATVIVTVPGANDAPTADFVAPATLDEGILGSFLDASTDPDGAVVAWEWTFDDGATSSASDPQHAWSEPGTRLVCLRVTDDEGAVSAQTCRTVEVVAQENAPPVAAFTSDAPMPTGATIAFTDLSYDPDGEIVAWSWSFDDGTTSDARDAAHAWYGFGEHAVCLTVTDDEGATGTACGSVLVTNRPPVAAFSNSMPLRTLEIVQFADLSIDTDGTIVSWTWTFGDGAGSTQPFPMHMFADNGAFDVCLSVTDDAGDGDIVCRTLLVENRPPVAAALFAPARPTSADVVSFTDHSFDDDGTIVAWRWEADGAPLSDAPHPAHRFASGTHVVVLTVTDDDGATGSVTLILEVTPLLAEGHAVALRASGPAALRVADAGNASTEAAHSREVAEHALVTEGATITGARARLDLAPGSARASASVAQARVALADGHVLEFEGASSSADATCAATTTAWSVGEIRLDGVPVAAEELPGALALLPLAPTVVFGATSQGPDGLEVRAVTVRAEGLELVLAESAAGLDGCPEALKAEGSDGGAWPSASPRGSGASSPPSISWPSPCPPSGCGAKRALTATRP